MWAKRANPKLIRPPGAVEESDFLAQCIKCSECMRVCPKNFLHPSFLEAGIEGMFTPIAIGKLGYCEHTCNACGYVCPTQAISKLTLYKKQQLKIGLALVKKDRCLTYAHQTPCIVCEEHCPTSPKAIWVKAKEVQKRDGTRLTVDQIYVDADLCIGCGICEYVCPVVDEPGIYITSVQESRSKSNQLLLRDND
jgi:ferredoxin